MRFSPLVERIAGDGADAWLTHYEAATALERGEDVIVLSIGDPPLETPAPVLERAIEMRGASCEEFLLENLAPRPLVRAPKPVLDSLERADAGILCMNPMPGELGARKDIVGVV